ncbi:MAG TPA: hypothetical protein VIV12_23060 [Streptosporangiaceae bacterium]
MDVSRISAFEQGELSDDDTLDLFADLIRTGAIWRMQAAYRHCAADLIEQGLVSGDGEWQT